MLQTFQKKPAATSEDRAWCRLLQMAPRLSKSRRFLQKRRHFAGHAPGQSAETMPAEGSHWWWHGWRGFRSFHGWRGWSVCCPKWFRPAGKATKCLKAKLGGSGILNWVQPMDLTKNLNLHPRELTLNPKIEVWKMFFLFQGGIFRFHVGFPGCINIFIAWLPWS